MNYQTHLSENARYRNGRERKPLAQSSIKLYSAMLGKLDRIRGDVEFTDTEALKKLIEETFPSYLTQKNYISAVIGYLETLPTTEAINAALDIYEKMRIEGNNQYNASLMTGELQGKQKENVVSKAQIDALMKRLIGELKENGKRENFQFLLFLKTYSLFPMRNELGTIRLVDIMDFNDNEDEKYNKGNWIVKTDNINRYKDKPDKIGTPFFKFVFNEYKTGKSYGQREIELPLSLRKLYHIYMYEYNIGEDEALFTLKNGNPMDNINLSKVLSRNFQKYLGKNISTTILRKIYYGSKYNKEDLQELEQDAKNAGHSVATAMSVYTTSSIPK